MKRKRLLLTIGLLLVLAAANWSLFKPGLFYIHDFVHAARIGEMARMLMDGQLPPRWSGNFGFGYGMPLFEFYAPFPYLIGAGLFLAGLPMEIIIKLLFGLTSIFTVVGAYLLGREMWGRGPGLLSAAALTLAPYRALNLFVRGALSEAFGMMTFPWILLAIYMIIVKKKRYWWPILSLFVSILFLSHNLSALLFMPFSVLFVGTLLLRKDTSKLDISPLMKGYGIGTAIASFYIFPSLLEKGYTKVDEYIVGNYFDYGVHFIGIRQLFEENWNYGGSAYGPNDTISFFLGYGQIAALAVGLIVMLYLIINSSYKRKFSSLRSTNLYWLFSLFLLGLAAIFMTHGKSVLIWNALPFLRYVQFPWRFLGVATVFVALFSVGAIYLAKSKYQKYIYATLFSLILVFNWQYFKPGNYLVDSAEYYYTEPERIQQEMSKVLPDYIPHTFNINTPPTDQPIIEPQDGVIIQTDNSILTEITTSFNKPTNVVFSRADFPGWKVFIDNNLTSKRVTADGAVAVLVPEGEHLVRAELTKTEVQRISDILSIVGLVIFVFLGTLELRRMWGVHG